MSVGNFSEQARTRNRMGNAAQYAGGDFLEKRLMAIW
jgi:hypothetical protein